MGQKPPPGRPRSTLSERDMMPMRAFARRGMEQYGGGKKTPLAPRVVAKEPRESGASPSPDVAAFFAAARSFKGADVAVYTHGDAGATPGDRIRLLKHFFERPMTTASVRLVFTMILQCDAARTWRRANPRRKDKWRDEFDRYLIDLATIDVMGIEATAPILAYVHSESVGTLAAFVVDALAGLIAPRNARQAREAVKSAIASERSHMAHALAFENALVDMRKAQADTVDLARAHFSLGPIDAKETTKPNA